MYKIDHISLTENLKHLKVVFFLRFRTLRILWGYKQTFMGNRSYTLPTLVGRQTKPLSWIISQDHWLFSWHLEAPNRWPLPTNTKSGLRLGSCLKLGVETTRSPKGVWSPPSTLLRLCLDTVQVLTGWEFQQQSGHALLEWAFNSRVGILLTLVLCHEVGSQRKNHGVISRIDIFRGQFHRSVRGTYRNDKVLF